MYNDCSSVCAVKTYIKHVTYWPIGAPCSRTFSLPLASTATILHQTNFSNLFTQLHTIFLSLKHYHHLSTIITSCVADRTRYATTAVPSVQWFHINQVELATQALICLVVLTFDLGGHGTCQWYWSLYFIHAQSLKFIDLHVRKILCIHCDSINQLGDLDLWPLNRFTGYPRFTGYSCDGLLCCQFWAC